VLGRLRPIFDRLGFEIENTNRYGSHNLRLCLMPFLQSKSCLRLNSYHREPWLGASQRIDTDQSQTAAVESGGASSERQRAARLPAADKLSAVTKCQLPTVRLITYGAAMGTASTPALMLLISSMICSSTRLHGAFGTEDVPLRTLFCHECRLGGTGDLLPGIPVTTGSRGEEKSPSKRDIFMLQSEGTNVRDWVQLTSCVAKARIHHAAHLVHERHRMRGGAIEDVYDRVIEDEGSEENLADWNLLRQ
jgi:hypothetical protein